MAAQNPAAPDSAENIEPTFEQTLSELENIVRQLEAGEKPLEESLALYERGVAAYRRCNQILEKAKSRIRLVLSGPNGEPILREGELPREQPQPHTAEPRRRKSNTPQPNPETRPSEPDSESAEESKIEEIPKQTVDSELQRQQNPRASLNPRSRSVPPKPTTGGGSLFGSA